MSVMTRFAAATTLGVAAALASGCGTGNATETPAEAAAAPILAAVPVETAAIFRGDALATHNGTVVLEADQEAAVVARVGGEIVEILVEEGDHVAADQVMARLDGDRLRLAMNETEALLNRTRQEYRRTVSLYERGLVSHDAHEKLRYDMESLEAGWKLARLQHSYTEIRAPMDGIVTRRSIRRGNTVEEGAELFTIANTQDLVAYLHVPQRDLSKFAAGQAATLAMDALPGESHEAQVERISPMIDSDTGTFKLTLTVAGSGTELRPGMFGRVGIVYDVHDDAMLIPRRALLQEDAETAIYVVEDGVARRRAVRTGIGTADAVEILDGLAGNEAVVVVGQSGLRDGAEVEVSASRSQI